MGSERLNNLSKSAKLVSDKLNYQNQYPGDITPGCPGVLCWQLVLLLKQYWSYPITMAVPMHSECKLSLSVTLCDMNPHWSLYAGLSCSMSWGTLQQSTLPPEQMSCMHQHLKVRDAFAWENIYALYKFNFNEGWDAFFAKILSHKLHFQLDRGIHLQHLSHLDIQYKVDFRLVSSETQGGISDNCFYCAYPSGIQAAQECYHFCYMDISVLFPSAWEVLSRSAPAIINDKMHWLRSPFGLCTDGAKGMDTELLYNTPNPMQVNGWQRESLNHVSSVAKVNILYQELKYHIVDEATVYSEWLERHRMRVPQPLCHGQPLETVVRSSILSVLELLLDVSTLARLLLGFQWLCCGKLS
uniref:LOW QUALITY PROTEIN: amiloride-sensitive sodium channel subunit delta n=1 Tax=Myodes glareolus TaxID=447135 RepID=UPI0020218570|nr:LOW QUALITY PROTEIN: amiloride-sensitive sodium channel subunit delta [Myodes glareolus]